jgi:hypothetical protein
MGTTITPSFSSPMFIIRILFLFAIFLGYSVHCLSNKNIFGVTVHASAELNFKGELRLGSIMFGSPTDNHSGVSHTCYPYQPSSIVVSSLGLGNIYSFPALSRSESVNTTQDAHCLTFRPMSPCFVTTSSSCRIYREILIQCHTETHVCVEIKDSFTYVRRAKTICHKKPSPHAGWDNLVQ